MASVMRIFTDINADKDLDGFVIAGFGHSVSLCIWVKQITTGAGTGIHVTDGPGKKCLT